MDLLENMSASKQPDAKTETFDDNDLCYDIGSIAKFLGCSKFTVQSLKSSGKIDRAIVQCGRKIIAKKTVILECLAEKDKK